MSTTMEQTNGNGEVSVSKTGRPPKDGETFPQGGTTIALDAEHRAQVDQWIAWYYPLGRVNLRAIVQEMMDLAFSVASDDNQRAETAEQRRARLQGRKP